MRPHNRPEQRHLHVEKESADGSCPECGATEMRRYPVLSEGGWWMVAKCQACLHSAERERWGKFGSMTLISDLL